MSFFCYCCFYSSIFTTPGSSGGTAQRSTREWMGREGWAESHSAAFSRFVLHWTDGWVGGMVGWRLDWIGPDRYPSLWWTYYGRFSRPLDEFFRLVFVVTLFYFCSLVEVEGRRSKWRCGWWRQREVSGLDWTWLDEIEIGQTERRLLRGARDPWTYMMICSTWLLCSFALIVVSCVHDHDGARNSASADPGSRSNPRKDVRWRWRWCRSFCMIVCIISCSSGGVLYLYKYKIINLTYSFTYLHLNISFVITLVAGWFSMRTQLCSYLWKHCFYQLTT